MIKIGSTVVVTWLDAHAGSDPSAMVSMDEIIALHNPVPVKTYGILLIQNAIGITLVGEFFPESNEYRGRTFVPAGMIQAVEILKVGRSGNRRRVPKSADHEANDKAASDSNMHTKNGPEGSRGSKDTSTEEH